MQTSDPLQIRLADPAADAEAVAEIYRPAVAGSVASFELEPPDAEETARRMTAVLGRTPWLVAVQEGRGIVGYAYAGPHHQRAGYRWSVDVSAYVHRDVQGRGIGRRLYAELLPILRRQRFVNVYAGITLPNPASVALHERIGMSLVGVYRRVGFKFGAWHDVAWYGVRLVEPEGAPPEPIPLPDLLARRGARDAPGD